MSDFPSALLCDSEPQGIRALKPVLRAAGVGVCATHTGEEALTRAAMQVPDVAIIELELVDASGTEVCRRLREWSSMPLIVVSLDTGDIGYVDSDGYFFIVDRSKNMIIRGGENIYPREIEEMLYSHPGILECAVIGVPDEVRGEEVLAVVAPRPGAELDGDGLRRWAAERLAAFKVPSRFEIRPELPKNATGKISKPPLREQFGRWAPARSSRS
jgi:acyl-CoA synthetase (AMP-forming)/AMP-acid ligase II